MLQKYFNKEEKGKQIRSLCPSLKNIYNMIHKLGESLAQCNWNVAMQSSALPVTPVNLVLVNNAIHTNHRDTDLHFNLSFDRVVECFTNCSSYHPLNQSYYLYMFGIPVICFQGSHLNHCYPWVIFAFSKPGF